MAYQYKDSLAYGGDEEDEKAEVLDHNPDETDPTGEPSPNLPPSNQIAKNSKHIFPRFI